MKLLIKIGTVVMVVTILASCSQDTKFASSNRFKQNSLTGNSDALVVNTGNEEISASSSYFTVIEKTFQASHISDGKAVGNVDANSFEFEVKMESNFETFSQKLQQVTRPDITDAFQQGNGGQAQDEEFSQVDWGALDLLVVVDNSGSMVEEQANLSTKMMSLLSAVKNTNWRIAVVTTDPVDPCLRALIKKGDAGAENTFSNSIKAGTNGSGYERGILQAVTGLKCPANQWLRPDSSVAVLIVSDEDNCSNGKDAVCVNQPYIFANYLTDYLSSIRKIGVDARVYGLIYIPGTTCATGSNVGNIYKSVIDSTNGIAGSICDADYSNTLKAISQNVATTLKAQFELKYKVDLGTEKITVNDMSISKGYSITGNILTFTTLPEPNSKIKISYRHGMVPIFNRVALHEDAAQDTIKVLVNGSVLDAKEYTFSENNNNIVFVNSPPENADIRVSYKKDIPLVKSYSVDPMIRPDTIAIKINGKSTKDYTFEKTNSEIVLKDYPQDGAEIEITYDKTTSPILTYPLSLPAMYRNIEVIDQEINQEVAYQTSQDRIIFAKDDFIEGRKIIIRYLVNLSSNTLVLPVKALPETVSIDIGGEVCQGDKVVVDGINVKLSCNFKNEPTFIVLFKYLSSVENKFSLPEIGQRNPDQASWMVLVNGVKAIDWSREGNTIIVNDILPPEAQVKIIASFGEK